MSIETTQNDRDDQVSIPSDIERYDALGILDILLKDHSTDGNIVWATSAYEKQGEGHGKRDQIIREYVTGDHAQLIRRRAKKDKDEKLALTRVHAEVFTPTWICKLMIDQIDEVWLDAQSIQTPQGNWRKYAESRRLEITCGEAPYLVNRYDAANGTPIPVNERIGILDRKLHLITANTKRRQDWMCWARKAVKATFGYEFQGDNLLIARINVLRSIENHLAAAGYKKLTTEELAELAEIVSWNLWQMDGLTGCVPFGKIKAEKPMTLFPGLFDDEFEEHDGRGEAFIKDWNNKDVIEYGRIKREGKKMKFDYVIGNPPYQEEQEGDNANYAPPIYNKFMEGAYAVSDRVELITPARFLFNAGSTPKAWNQLMLNDPHLKVEYYEADSSKVFPATDIKGGVAITYRDATKDFGAIKTFTAFPELTSIYKKAGSKVECDSLASIIVTQVRFNLDALYADYPELKNVIGSNGKDRRFRNNIFDKVKLFTDVETEDTIKVLGIQKNKRTWKYIDKKYVDLNHDNLNTWKVLLPRANGSGALGEVLSTPLIGTPLIGFTQSFIAFGCYETEEEAQACMKYLKSKFARTLLGVLKITQDNDRGVWKYVPLQDFTSNSDIDWSQSVAEIDVQLYKKYGLSQDEIDFIETHVKEMN